MSKQVDHLFGRFYAIYGHKWKSVFCDKPLLDAAKLEWATVIDRLDEEDIGHAVEVVKRTHDWPPSIAEFTKIALRIEERDIKDKLFPRGTGPLTYSQVDKKLKRERLRALSQLIEERLLPTQSLLEKTSEDERFLGKPINELAIGTRR